MKNIYIKYVKQNLGLINLFGKSFGRIIFLLLTSFFAYKLSYKDFAAYAIFWTTLRMLTFLTTNNLYIIYFGKVREKLLFHKKWPKDVSINIILNFIFFGLISFIVAYLIFNSFLISCAIYTFVLFFVIIRNLSEFSKCDNSLFLSIFIEDFLFYFVFFITSILIFLLSPSFFGIISALFISLLLTSVVTIILFIRKFKIEIVDFSFNKKLFSLVDFKLGLNYTFLRGNDFFASFGVRYLGQLYYGDIFVSYAHVMYQFYNVFTIITVSVISGLQSKVTISKEQIFNRLFVKKMYKNIFLTVLPFIATIIIIIQLFSYDILKVFFTKYIQYSDLLVKVSYIGVVLMFIQPLVFIQIYNNKVYNIRRINFVQYSFLLILYMLPFCISGFNEQFWLLINMIVFLLIQGVFSLNNYFKTT